MLSLLNIYLLFSLIPPDLPDDMVALLIFIYVIFAFIAFIIGLRIWGYFWRKNYPEEVKKFEAELAERNELRKQRKKEEKKARERYKRYEGMALRKYPGIGRYYERKAYIEYLYEIDA